MSQFRTNTIEKHHKAFINVPSGGYIFEHQPYHCAVVRNTEVLWNRANDKEFITQQYAHRFNLSDVENLFRYGIAAHLLSDEDFVFERLVPLTAMGGETLSELQSQLGYLISLFQEDGDIITLVERLSFLSNDRFYQFVLLLFLLPETTLEDAQKLIEVLKEKIPSHDLVNWKHILSVHAMARWCQLSVQRLPSHLLMSIIQYVDMKKDRLWKMFLEVLFHIDSPSLYPFMSDFITHVFSIERDEKVLKYIIEHGSRVFCVHLVEHLYVQHPLWSSLSASKKNSIFSKPISLLPVFLFLHKTSRASYEESALVMSFEAPELEEQLREQTFPSQVQFLKKYLLSQDRSSPLPLRRHTDVVLRFADHFFAEQEFECLYRLLRLRSLPKYDEWNREYAAQKDLQREGRLKIWWRNATWPFQIFLIFLLPFVKDPQKKAAIKIKLAMFGLLILKYLSPKKEEKKEKEEEAPPVEEKEERKPEEIRSEALMRGDFDLAYQHSHTIKEQFEVRREQHRNGGDIQEEMERVAREYLQACEEESQEKKELFADKIEKREWVEYALVVLSYADDLERITAWLERKEYRWDLISQLMFFGSKEWNTQMKPVLDERIKQEKDNHKKKLRTIDVIFAQDNSQRIQEDFLTQIQSDSRDEQLKALSVHVLLQSIEDPNIVQQLAQSVGDDTKMKIFMNRVEKAARDEDLKLAAFYADLIEFPFFRQIIFTSTLVPLKIKYLLKEGNHDEALQWSERLKHDDVPWHHFVEASFSSEDTQKGVHYLKQAVKAIDASSLSSMKTRKASQIAKALQCIEDIPQRLQYADQVENHLISIGVRLLSFREGCSKESLEHLYGLCGDRSAETFENEADEIDRQREVFRSHCALAELECRNQQYERSLKNILEACNVHMIKIFFDDWAIIDMLKTLLSFPKNERSLEKYEPALASVLQLASKETLSKCIVRLIQDGRREEAWKQIERLYQEKDSDQKQYLEYKAAILSAFLKLDLEKDARRLLKKESAISSKVGVLLLSIHDEKTLFWVRKYTFDFPFPQSIYQEIVQFLQIKIAHVAAYQYREIFSLLLLGFSGRASTQGALFSLACAVLREKNIEAYNNIAKDYPDIQLPILEVNEETLEV